MDRLNEPLFAYRNWLLSEDNDDVYKCHRAAIDDCMKHLTENQQTVAGYLMMGFSRADIARKLGINRSSVTAVTQRIERELTRCIRLVSEGYRIGKS